MKKIIYAVLVCLVIAGMIVIATIGLNVDLIYSENNRINVKVGKSFDISQVKEVTNEVFKNKQVLLQKVELFEDMLSITVREVSQEQLENLNQKLNEKLGIENKVENIDVTYSPNVKLRTILRPYLVPVGIATVLILAYMGIRYCKLGTVKVILKTVGIIVVAEAILLSVIAITRYPVDRIVMPVALIVYTISITGYAMKNENKLRESIELNKKKNKS